MEEMNYSLSLAMIEEVEINVPLFESVLSLRLSI
jgi:hypothetical protein